MLSERTINQKISQNWYSEANLDSKSHWISKSLDWNDRYYWRLVKFTIRDASGNLTEFKFPKLRFRQCLRDNLAGKCVRAQTIQKSLQFLSHPKPISPLHEYLSPASRNLVIFRFFTWCLKMCAWRLMAAIFEIEFLWTKLSKFVVIKLYL